MKFRNKVYEMSGRKPSVPIITLFMKNDLRYAYKRGNSRPMASKNKRLPYMQSIFWWRVMSRMKKGIMIANIDESAYTRVVKQNYSWLPISKSSSLINSRCVGRASLIFWLLTNGHWIGILTNKTTDSNAFCRFLLLVRSYCLICFGIESSHLKITLDNAPIHVSKKTQKGAEYLGIQMITLPPYSPILAPCEWVFGMSKSTLAQVKSIERINFGKRSGQRTIVDAVSKLTSTKGCRLWSLFVRNSKEIILRTTQPSI